MVLHYKHDVGEWYSLEQALAIMDWAISTFPGKVFWIRNRTTDEVIPSTIL